MLQVKSIVNGHFCWFNEREFSKAWEGGNRTNVCPLCNSKIEVGDKMYMVINNGKLFPNVLIHKTCIINDMTMTTRRLSESYDKYNNELKRLHQDNKGWLNK